MKSSILQISIHVHVGVLLQLLHTRIYYMYIYIHVHNYIHTCTCSSLRYTLPIPIHLPVSIIIIPFHESAVGSFLEQLLNLPLAQLRRLHSKIQRCTYIRSTIYHTVRIFSTWEEVIKEQTPGTYNVHTMYIRTFLLCRG